jgi:hypothetical protein
VIPNRFIFRVKRNSLPKPKPNTLEEGSNRWVTRPNTVEEAALEGKWIATLQTLQPSQNGNLETKLGEVNGMPFTRILALICSVKHFEEVDYTSVLDVQFECALHLRMRFRCKF